VNALRRQAADRSRGGSATEWHGAAMQGLSWPAHGGRRFLLTSEPFAVKRSLFSFMPIISHGVNPPVHLIDKIII
jgi:hypothetical protein